MSESEPPTAGRATTQDGFIRRLYNWTMAKAAGPNARLMLFVIAFAESSFFPIPPDVMLVPMCLAARARAFLLAGWCTLGSAIGGGFGYLIGAFLFESVGRWLVEVYGLNEGMDAFRNLYTEWGIWAVLIGALTPIPYKLVTIASGIAGYDFAMFMLFSFVARGLRFELEAALVYTLGEPVREFVEKRLEVVVSVVVALIIAGFVAIRFLF
jgi:membrane protein YqaA with SNARE-associated domain